MVDIRHKFISQLVDDPSNPQKVKPSNWNSSHDVFDLNLIDVTTPSKNEAVNVTNLEEAYNSFWSSGIISGGTITDNLDGTVSIASGEAMLRSDIQANSPLFNITFPAKNNITLVDNESNYICAVYIASGDYAEVQNIGINISTFNCRTSCIMWLVSRSGNEVYKVDARFQNLDSNVKHRRVLLECDPFRHADALGGTIVESVSGNYFKVTSGKFYYGLASMLHGEFDTNILGTDNLNVFRYYRNNGSGGWITELNQKEINNQYYDLNGVLTIIGNNRFKTDWIYLVFDNEAPHIAVLYSTETYKTLAYADASTPPLDIPPILEHGSVLIGRYIVEYLNPTFSKIDSIYQTILSLAGTTNHNDLSNLNGVLLVNIIT
jgi:hypothetical protein